MIRALQEHITATFFVVCLVSTLAYLWPDVRILGVLQVPMWVGFFFVVHVQLPAARPRRA